MNTAQISKSSTHILIISFILLAVLAFFLFTYILMAANIINNGYSANDLERRIHILKKENNSLLVELSQTSALNNVLERSSGMSFTEIGKVTYIKKAPESPFAVR